MIKETKVSQTIANEIRKEVERQVEYLNIKIERLVQNQREASCGGHTWRYERGGYNQVGNMWITTDGVVGICVGCGKTKHFSSEEWDEVLLKQAKADVECLSKKLKEKMNE